MGARFRQRCKSNSIEVFHEICSSKWYGNFNEHTHINSLIVVHRLSILIYNNLAGASDNRQEYFLKILSHAINRVDFKHVEVAHRIDSQTSIDDLIQFALTNLSHDYHTVRVACMTIIKCMSKYLIQGDSELLSKRQEKQTIDESADSSEWHLLHKFRTILTAQTEWTPKFIEEFK